MIRKIGKWFGITFLVVGGLIAILWPVENWRLYDANWQPLAMTEAEAYCSGFLLGQTGSNDADPVAMQNCFDANPKMDNTTPDIANVVANGCTAFGAVTGYPIGECISIFEQYDLWWLADGGYTWEWNDSNQRPQVVHTSINKAPRRDGRDDESRNDMGREFSP